MLFLANIWGWVWAHKKLVLYIAAGLGLLLLLVFAFRSCGKKTAKVDLETVDRINSKNATEARKDVNAMVEENINVAEVVGNRTALADANAVERDRFIEEKKKVVNDAVAAAKAEGRNVTQEELQCLLVPSDCQ